MIAEATARPKISDLSPEEKAIRLEELRLRYRLRGKIKQQVVQSKRRRSEERLIRDSGREESLSTQIDTRLKARILRASLRKNRSISDLIRRERTIVIRRETRSQLLAYGFLRGRDYLVMERICYMQPDWGRVEKLVVEHSRKDDQRIVMQRFTAWLDTARASNAFRSATQQ